MPEFSGPNPQSGVAFENPSGFDVKLREVHAIIMFLHAEWALQLFSANIDFLQDREKTSRAEDRKKKCSSEPKVKIESARSNHFLKAGINKHGSHCDQNTNWNLKFLQLLSEYHAIFKNKLYSGMLGQGGQDFLLVY